MSPIASKVRLIAAMSPALLANRASTTGEITRATVDVGRVFGAGGTDGLILYALVLSNFLMFIVVIAVIFWTFRYIARSQQNSAAAFAEKDRANADQTKAFTAAVDRTTDAINRFTGTFAADMQERAGQSIILSRLERTDTELIGLLKALGRD
jgi:cbb3-type cytochrome oxidase subunit 3